LPARDISARFTDGSIYMAAEFFMKFSFVLPLFYFGMTAGILQGSLYGYVS
jgi:hypothetical protein